MALISLGNHAAFEILVQKYTTISYQIAFKILRSKEASEDITQECFLKLWQNPHLFDASKNIKFSTWFSKVITNRCLDQLKKNREILLSEYLEEEFNLIDEAKNQLKILEEEEEKNNLKQALLKMSPHQQQALKLSFFEKKKNQESAKIMGLSLKAFQSLLIRSKHSLRSTIEKNILRNEKNY